MSSFQRDRQSATKNSSREGICVDGSTNVADEVVVFRSPHLADKYASHSTKVVNNVSTQTVAETTVEPEHGYGSDEAFRRHFNLQGISEEVTDFLISSWRGGTLAQYRSAINRWVRFCNGRKVDSFQPPINCVLEFLFELFKDYELGYSALNTARSALSNFIIIDGLPVGQHVLVKRFMKAVFNQRPALPKYNVTWDTTLVLNFLRQLSPVKFISLACLTKKLLMLMLFLSGQRGQSMHLLDVRNMTLTYSSATFRIGDVTKTTRPGNHTSAIAFKAYAPDRRLCVITVLKAYLERTNPVRNSTKLFLTIKPPTRAVSPDTIRRWTKETLKEAGVDMSIFTPHSTRMASTSKANSSKLLLQTILKTAGWSKECTFRKYYGKPIDKKFEFCNSILC